MNKSTPFRYGDLEFIASGGMAQVYACERIHRASGEKHRVAVKQMRVDLDWTPARVERFNLECRILNSLASENIVHCYGIDIVENKKSIVMEYVACTLEDIISLVFEPRDQQSTTDGTQRSHPLGLGCSEQNNGQNYGQAHAVHLLRGILQALKSIETFSDADGKVIRLIHRDLKPSNVLVTPQGVVKLADFGVSKIISQDSLLNEELKLTEGGVGTISYRAPEQAFAGQDLDCRADLYSAGAIAFELLTGKVLFSILPGGIRSERDHRELRCYLSHCPEPLAALVCDLVRRDREERPRSASVPLSTLKDFGKESASLQLGALVRSAVSRKEGRRRVTRIEAKAAGPRPTPRTQHHLDTPSNSGEPRAAHLPTPLAAEYGAHNLLALPREWLSRYPRWFKVASVSVLGASFAASLAFRHLVFPPTVTSDPSPPSDLPSVASITVNDSERVLGKTLPASLHPPPPGAPKKTPPRNTKEEQGPALKSDSTDAPTPAANAQSHPPADAIGESDALRKTLTPPKPLVGEGPAVGNTPARPAPEATAEPKPKNPETRSHAANPTPPGKKFGNKDQNPSPSTTQKKKTQASDVGARLTSKEKKASTPRGTARPDSAKGLRTLWCKEVQQPFSHQFASRYPFLRNAAIAASPAKLRAFLHPSTGRLWKQLQAFSLQYDPTSHRYKNDEHAKGKAVLSASALEFLRWLRILALSLYPTEKGQTGGLVLTLSAGEELAKLSLRAGRAAPLAATPGRSATSQIASPLDLRQLSLSGEIEVRGRKEEIEFARAIGPWALLRLLESTEVEWSEGLRFRLRWTKGDAGKRYSATLGVKSKRRLNPLLGGPGKGSRGLMQSFRIRAPKRPFASGHSCP